jgi:hypothetical protein
VQGVEQSGFCGGDLGHPPSLTGRADIRQRLSAITAERAAASLPAA